MEPNIFRGFGRGIVGVVVAALLFGLPVASARHTCETAELLNTGVTVDNVASDSVSFWKVPSESIVTFAPIEGDGLVIIHYQSDCYGAGGAFPLHLVPVPALVEPGDVIEVQGNGFEYAMIVAGPSLPSPSGI